MIDWVLLECLSTLNKPCIFPFSYKSTVHEKCTHVGSENGAAWCATEVSDSDIAQYQVTGN